MSRAEAAVVKVGIADVQVARYPDKIRTSGLGSCVGLVLYDKDKQTAGLVHVIVAGLRFIKNGGAQPCKIRGHRR